MQLAICSGSQCASCFLCFSKGSGVSVCVLIWRDSGEKIVCSAGRFGSREMMYPGICLLVWKWRTPRSTCFINSISCFFLSWFRSFLFLAWMLPTVFSFFSVLCQWALLLHRGISLLHSISHFDYTHSSPLHLSPTTAPFLPSITKLLEIVVTPGAEVHACNPNVLGG